MGLSDVGSAAQHHSLPCQGSLDLCSGRFQERHQQAPVLSEILPCPHSGCWDIGELRQVHSAKGKPEPPGTKQTDSKAQTEEGRVKEWSEYMNAINQPCLKSPSLASSPTVPPTKPQRKAAVESPPVAHRWPTRPVVVKTVKTSHQSPHSQLGLQKQMLW